MKQYTGDRTIDGIEVFVGGQPLDPQLDIEHYTDQGFEWSYEGPEPRQLALALLVDHLADHDRARQLSDAFMRAVVAKLDNTWQIDSDDIDAALAKMEN